MIKSVSVNIRLFAAKPEEKLRLIRTGAKITTGSKWKKGEKSAKGTAQSRD